MISEFCRKCSGEGRIRVKKNMKVKVPPGVSPGSILRVAGEGDAGPRGYAVFIFLSGFLIVKVFGIGYKLYYKFCVYCFDCIYHMLYMFPSVSKFFSCLRRKDITK